MPRRRLYNTVRYSSDLRALVVLIIMLSLRAYRILQYKWYSLPSIIEVRNRIYNWFDSWISRITYEAHWIKG